MNADGRRLRNQRVEDKTPGAKRRDGWMIRMTPYRRDDAFSGDGWMNRMIPAGWDGKVGG